MDDLSLDGPNTQEQDLISRGFYADYEQLKSKNKKSFERAISGMNLKGMTEVDLGKLVYYAETVFFTRPDVVRENIYNIYSAPHDSPSKINGKRVPFITVNDSALKSEYDIVDAIATQGYKPSAPIGESYGEYLAKTESQDRISESKKQWLKTYIKENVIAALLEADKK